MNLDILSHLVMNPNKFTLVDVVLITKKMQILQTTGKEMFTMKRNTISEKKKANLSKI